MPASQLIMRNLFAEFIGAFALVFAGTGAIVINQDAGGTITHPGVSITFGLIVLVMIYTFGDVSGAHLNPAATTGFAISRRFPWREVPGYVAAQVLGALAASGVLRLLFPASTALGSSLPADSAGQSFVLEVILTFLLMLVILSVSTGSQEKGHYSRNCRRLCDRSGSDVRRPHLWRLHESCPLVCASSGKRTSRTLLGLSHCPGDRGCDRDPGLLRHMGLWAPRPCFFLVSKYLLTPHANETIRIETAS